MDHLARVDVGQPDWPGLPRERMIAVAGQTEGIGGDLGLDHVRGGAGAARDGNVERSVRDHPGEDFGDVVVQGDRQIRMQLPERTDGGCNQR